MLQIERLEKIKEYLVKNEYADILKLSEILDVSTATVRRALKQLHNDKIVDLTRGGAALAKKGNLYEHPYLVKRQMHAEEKRRIANEAVRHIDKNESVFLDSSSTVYEMTRYLMGFQNITVATNDVLIAGALTNAEDITVSVVGGSLRKHYYTLTGYFSEMIMKDLCFDHAFLGIDTISLKGGLMITNIEEVQIKRKVVQAANEVIVLCDHSKFEQESFLNVCGFDDIDMIITGKELDEAIYKKYVDAGVHIVLV
jgi:DeoR/GlpR family transcriptional regulator of sugar metabolism